MYSKVRINRKVDRKKALALRKRNEEIKASNYRLLKNILEYFKDTTVLFISHRLSNLKKANKIILMSDGTVVEEGNHEDLMKLNGRYKTLYNQQEAEATWTN